MRNEILQKLKKYITDEILRSPNEKLNETDALLELGILDSFAMVNIIGYIESEFRVQVPENGVVPANFDNLAHLSSFVEKLIQERDTKQTA